MEGKKEQVMIPLEKLEPSPYNTFMNEKVNKINKDTDVILLRIWLEVLNL